ncbi:MAG: GxxExxY protein [Spirochaetia bacterium]
MAQLLFSQLSQQVLGACFSVHNGLGPVLLESAYRGALAIEFQQQGLAFGRQVVYPVYYKGHMAGAYVADMVVAGKIILELKSVQSLNKVMEAQLLNYLRLSKVPVGYLVNFNGEKVVWRRFVYGAVV